jgi:hypothetical protein
MSFSCSVCDSDFKATDGLKVHMQEKHPGEFKEIDSSKKSHLGYRQNLIDEWKANV